MGGELHHMKMGFALLGDMTVSPYFAGPRMLKKEIRTYSEWDPTTWNEIRGFSKETLTQGKQGNEQS